MKKTVSLLPIILIVLAACASAIATTPVVSQHIEPQRARWETIFGLTPPDYCENVCKHVYCPQHCAVVCAGSIKTECVPKCEMACLPACVQSCQSSRRNIYLPMITR
jgi:hypothetical protein